MPIASSGIASWVVKLPLPSVVTVSRWLPSKTTSSGVEMGSPVPLKVTREAGGAGVGVGVGVGQGLGGGLCGGVGVEHGVGFALTTFGLGLVSARTSTGSKA